MRFPRLLDPKSHTRISFCRIFTRFPVQIGAFLTTGTTSLVLLGLVLPVSVGPHFLGISSHCECGSAFKRRQANRRFDKAPHGGPHRFPRSINSSRLDSSNPTPKPPETQACCTRTHRSIVASPLRPRCYPRARKPCAQFATRRPSIPTTTQHLETPRICPSRAQFRVLYNGAALLQPSQLPLYPRWTHTARIYPAFPHY